MTKRAISAIYLAAAILTLTFGVCAQSQSSEEVIKIETTLVTIPVIVSDRQGRYIAGLEAKDFTLFQDGIAQSIDFFAATEEPLNVAILIDTSRSTAEVLPDIKNAATGFVERMQPQDKAMIVSFDYAPHILSSLTANQKDLKRAIERAEIGEQFGTTLRDAVNEVVEKSFAGIKGRKAIILLTDGKDFGSDVSTEDLIYSVEESDTLIYSIFYQTGPAAFSAGNRGGIFRRRERGGIFGGRLPPDDDNRFPIPPQRSGRRRGQSNEAATEFLQKMADATAGRFYRSEVADLTNTFGLIIDELRYQYRLGFYPPNAQKDAALHPLKVRVSRADAIVRARQNYRASSK
ncbi:MAG: VWA domain-containing protein [Pyrinomonadaceae bacterium]